MDRSSGEVRAHHIAAAAASDLNDELTIILSSVLLAIEAIDDPTDIVYPLLGEIRGAAQRCAWKASGLLNYGVRHGVYPVAATLESLLD
jgi:hypothetical protein